MVFSVSRDHCVTILVGILRFSVQFNFSEEVFHKSLFVNITDEHDSLESIILKIHINKPPAEDMIYLWGGMTVFWASIGAYVIYLSNKFRVLSDKSGLEDGRREKN